MTGFAKTWHKDGRTELNMKANSSTIQAHQ